MNKKTLVITSSIAFFVFSQAYALIAYAGKIDPLLTYLAEQSIGEGAQLYAGKGVFKAVSITRGGVPSLKVIIKTSDPEATKATIEGLGGSVGVSINEFITAYVPADAVEKLADAKEVEYIEAARPLRAKMDYARNSGISNVVDVQDEYQGEGVLIGIIDSGVDCSHEDFGGRVIYYYFGDTYEQPQATECRRFVSMASDRGLHGTHVAGIAAGGDEKYTGVAPKAEIIAVQLKEGTSDEVIDGLDHIFGIADRLKRPVVVNLSLGTSLGAHDGTSLLEQSIAGYLKGSEGRILTCASGNENTNPNDKDIYGLGGLHASVSIKEGDGDIGYRAHVRDNGAMQTTVDVWLKKGGRCNLEVAVYDQGDNEITHVGPVEVGKKDSGKKNGITVNVDFSEGENPNNGMQHGLVTLGFSASTDPTKYSYDLIFRNNGGCEGHVWLYPDSTAENIFEKGVSAGTGKDYTYKDGDSDYMITIPATTPECITVASFSARNVYKDKNGQDEYQNVYDGPANGTGTGEGELSLFSSRGPGAGEGNRQKPDIAAPGEPIISTRSSVSGNVSSAILGDDKHIKLEGTSMAAPFVAGIAALMLEKDGCLTYSDAMDILKRTAYKDAYTGSNLPDYGWGYGKVDAKKALDMVEASGCVPDNSKGGGSGCAIVERESDKRGLEGLILFILIFLSISLLPRRRARTKGASSGAQS